MIYGMDADPLEDGAMPVEAFAFVKYLGADGETHWATRSTDGCDTYEIATLFRVEARRIEQDIIDRFEEGE